MPFLTPITPTLVCLLNGAFEHGMVRVGGKQNDLEKPWAEAGRILSLVVLKCQFGGEASWTLVRDVL